MVSAYVDQHLLGLSEALNRVDRARVWAVIAELMRALRERRQVLIFGNGGSAALASHMVNDLGKLVVPGMRRMRAMALADNVPILTAWANDVAYECVFAEQLQNLCQPGDVAIAISCSGNSPNVLQGARTARELGATVVAFTGDTGGQLAGLADLCVYAPIADIGQQEDIHMALDHVIADTLRRWLTEIAQRLAQPPQALILAAGEGTRLQPYTRDRPKPMVPIGGRPLLEHTLSWLARYGVHDIAVNLHYCPQAIPQHFGDGTAYGAHLHYAREEHLLGTAGAVRNLGDFLDGRPLVVVYGDVLTDLDLSALLTYHHEKATGDPAAKMTLSLYPMPNPTEVGLVEMGPDGRVTRFQEKPRPEDVFGDLANAGVLVLEPEILAQIPPDTFYDFGHHVLPKLLAAGTPVYGWVIPQETYLLDIGTLEKYAQAQREWPLRHPDRR
jgi:mannose-1-phosphate guanylyltransferase